MKLDDLHVGQTQKRFIRILQSDPDRVHSPQEISRFFSRPKSEGALYAIVHRIRKMHPEIQIVGDQFVGWRIVSPLN